MVNPARRCGAPYIFGRKAKMPFSDANFLAAEISVHSFFVFDLDSINSHITFMEKRIQGQHEGVQMTTNFNFWVNDSLGVHTHQKCHSGVKIDTK